MMLKAIYQGDKRKCYVNGDFIVDAFPFLGNGEQILAYTYDNDRTGYIIDKEEWDKFIKVEEE